MGKVEIGIYFCVTADILTYVLVFEGRMWDLIVSVPDHCLSFYFTEMFLK